VATRGVSLGELGAALLFLGGTAAATYYFEIFDTSGGGAAGYEEIHKMLERQQGMTLGGVAAVTGLVAMVVLKCRRS
jgi:hypothetical protein